MQLRAKTKKGLDAAGLLLCMLSIVILIAMALQTAQDNGDSGLHD